MVLADIARAAVLLSLPVAYLLDAVTLGQLIAVALLTGAGQVVFNMAYPSFFVALVDRDSYLDANSKLSTSRAASFVAGPAVGGALIQAVTAPVAVLVDAVSFAVSAVLLGRLRVDEGLRVQEQSSPLAGRAAEGLRFISRHPIPRACLGCSTTLNFFTFVGNALLVLFARRQLGLSAGVIGLAFGVGAVGGLLGAALAPALARRMGVGRSIVAGAVLFPAPRAGRRRRRLAIDEGSRPFRGRAAVQHRCDALRREPERPADGRHAGRAARPDCRCVQRRQLRSTPVGGGRRWHDASMRAAVPGPGTGPLRDQRVLSGRDVPAGARHALRWDRTGSSTSGRFPRSRLDRLGKVGAVKVRFQVHQ